MAEILDSLMYTESHEWLRQDEPKVVTVGITAHAQQRLGDVVFVELPAVGDELNAGGECGVVESVKAASDFYSPVSGKVVAVNDALSDAPALVNQDPYGDGWLVQVSLSQPGELDDLLDADDYSAQVATEAGETQS
jgi:glycine cleavage system H protein